MKVKLKKGCTARGIKPNKWYYVHDTDGSQFELNGDYGSVIIESSKVYKQPMIKSADDIMTFGKYKGKRAGDISPYYLFYLESREIISLGINKGIPNPYYVNYKKRRR